MIRAFMGRLTFVPDIARSLLAVPLHNHEGDHRNFEVLNKKTGAFNQEDEEILKALAAQAAIAIETAQLMDEMKRHRDQLQEENAQLWKEVEGRFSTQSIIGTSERIHAVLRLIDQISNSSVAVLITGESGTGKELAAKAIHYKSPRTRKPFVALNCAALPESLVESELFGIERGVATGVERRLGKFEAANGGTLLLDEIGDLSLTAQAKLLRVLKRKSLSTWWQKAHSSRWKFYRRQTKISSGDKKGTREDLYYRLKASTSRCRRSARVRGHFGLSNYLLATYCREMKMEPVNLTRKRQAPAWIIIGQET